LGDKLFIGKPNNGLLRRGVLEFDLSTVPEFAHITGVTLDLSVIEIPANAQNGSATLHLALAEWGESTSTGNGNGGPSQIGDTTWVHTFFDTVNWNSAGGDYSPQLQPSALSPI